MNENRYIAWLVEHVDEFTGQYADDGETTPSELNRRGRK